MRTPDDWALEVKKQTRKLQRAIIVCNTVTALVVGTLAFIAGRS